MLSAIAAMAMDVIMRGYVMSPCTYKCDLIPIALLANTEASPFVLFSGTDYVRRPDRSKAVVRVSGLPPSVPARGRARAIP